MQYKHAQVPCMLAKWLMGAVCVCKEPALLLIENPVVWILDMEE